MSLDAVKLIDRDLKLFVLPDLYFRLRDMLNSQRYSMADLAKLIGLDPAISARLLRLVNSSFFGFATRIDSVSRAVAMLGTQQLHDLVLASSVAESFSGISPKVVNMRDFWQRSVFTGLLARQLATECNVLDGELLFLGGLLRDLGHLVIYQAVPELATQSLEMAASQSIPLFKAERQIIGADFAQVGGAMLRAWNLPESLRQMVEYHQEPGRASEFRLFATLVYIASNLVDARHAGLEPTFEDGLVQEAGLDAPRWDAAYDLARQQVESVVSLLFQSAAR